MNNYYFTSESVSSGHPDKMADQISDAILDEFLSQDRESKVACETLLTDGLVVVAGEAHSEAYVDIKKIASNVIGNIGYTPQSCFDPDNFGLINCLHEQSSDIRQGVDREKEEEQGAGDQGIMFGYACNETSSYMPATLVLANKTLEILENVRKTHFFNDIFPDAKSQYTLEYDGETRQPIAIKTILISTQHSEDVTEEKLRWIITEYVIPRVIEELPELSPLFNTPYELLINPTGRFVIGGPKGDTGLTGRKIIVDTYGGRGYHGGGAFSGKDPSKVDRSAAYMARYLAKNIVASELADECTVQLSYAIGMAQPLSVYVNTNGTGKISDISIAKMITDKFNLTPSAIVKRFGLKNPIYLPTATYGHFGKEPYIKDGIEFFGWEKLDATDFKFL